MRLSAIKDILVVLSILAGVAFAGTSLVQALSSPAKDNAPEAALCTVDSNVVSIAAEEPTLGDPECS